MSQLIAVLFKELLDGFRDKRALSSALIFPLLGPLMVAGMLFTMADTGGDKRELELSVVNAEQAPGLLHFLESHGVEVDEAPDDYEELLSQEELAAVLKVPDDYGEDFRAGKTARLELIVDSSRPARSGDRRELRILLERYNQQVGALRLMSRGVDPTLARPILVDQNDLASPEASAASILEMVAMFILLACFVCSMYLAIDTTAGERERRSLEPLLINPVPAPVLVAGKWTAAAIFGVLGVLLTTAVMMFALSQVPLENLGLRVVLTPQTIGLVILISLPIALLAAALQLLVASFARSFKEAQTYLSLILFLPMAPGMVMSLKPVQTAWWMDLIPGLAQQLLIGDVFRGDPLEPARYALAAASCVVLAAIMLALTTVLFRRESIVFRG